MDRPKPYKSKYLEEEARYRDAIRGSSNRHLQSESKMLDAQEEAEQKVLASRRRRSPRGNIMAPMHASSKKTRKNQLAGIDE